MKDLRVGLVVHHLVARVRDGDAQSRLRTCVVSASFTMQAR